MPHFISAAPLGQLAALDVHQLYKLRVDVFVHEQRCPYAEIDATDADLHDGQPFDADGGQR